MTVVLKKLSTLAACVLIAVLDFSPVLSLSLARGPHRALQVEGRPFELTCVIKGETAGEIEGLRIEWEGPDVDTGKDIKIAGNDRNGNITVMTSEKKFTSTLKLSGPPKLNYARGLSYTCKVIPSKDNLQANFPIFIIKADVVPQIHPQKLEPAKYQENVEFKCTVSYYYEDTLKLSLILSLIKDEKFLANQSFPYKKSNQTETIKHTVKVKSFKDGGTYVCRWKLVHEKDFIVGNNSLFLSILPYLSGPKEKEVKGDAGSDVKLHCDVVGFPITYEWRDEKDLIGNNTRFRPKENTLFIDDIDYGDRQTYTCNGFVENGTLSQDIILRVKDPLAPLWPFIGILVEAILVAGIILLSELYKRKQNEKDGVETNKEITDQPSTSQT